MGISGGAAGATIEKLSLKDDQNQNTDGLSKAREVCKLMVPENKLESIIEAMTKANAFGDKAKAIIYSASVDKAFTYRNKAA